jgi:hypothetical protein
MQAQNAKDIAELTNDTTLKEREANRELFGRAYLTAKTKEAQERAKLDLEGAVGKPIALVAPSIEVAVADARAELARRLFGWDKSLLDDASVLGIPIVMALIELTFPLIGFRLYPRAIDHPTYRPPRPSIAETVRQLSKAEAREDLLAYTAGNNPALHNQAWAERWGASEPQASKWLADFRREGHIRQQRSGRRKIVLAALKVVNGNGAVKA